MNAITVTREYGAGGYEIAAKLAASLGWELLDRNLLHQAAAVEHLPDSELERLDEKAGSLADQTLHGFSEGQRVDLVLDAPPTDKSSQVIKIKLHEG